MGDIKLFKQEDETLTELSGIDSPLEKSQQTLFEKNLETLLGVRFLASEFITSNADEWTLSGWMRMASP